MLTPGPDNDGDGDDEDSSKKIQHAKLGAKECVGVDIEEEGLRQGTGMLETSDDLQKNAEETLESFGVEFQQTNWVQHEQELVLHQIRKAEQCCNSHRQRKLLDLQGGEESLDQGDLVDQLVPILSQCVQDKLRSQSGEVVHMS